MNKREYRNVIASGQYFFFAEDLPNSMSVNKKILRRSKANIIDFTQLKDGKIIMPINEVAKFKKIIERVINENK
jgi:hypothetical protein